MDRAAVIMAGGTGKRFWPVSRKNNPKQVVKLLDEKTMLEKTIERLSSVYQKQGIFVITAREHEEVVAEVCSELPRENIIGEPEGRDTAACAGWGGLIVEKRFGPETVIGVFPADHSIAPEEDFSAAVNSACEAAVDLEGIVTFGIKPDHPATGYGYINYTEKHAEEIAGKQFFRVRQFAEKPEAKMAQAFLDSGNYLWNSGMFFWTAGRILKEIKLFMPELHEGLNKIEASWEKRGNWEQAATDFYSKLPRISVDYGILEKSNRVWTLPVEFNWQDLGTWDSVGQHLSGETEGENLCMGDVKALDSSNNILINRGDSFIGCVGVEDLVVVSSSDAILICHREQSEMVKQLVNQLDEEGRHELL